MKNLLRTEVRLILRFLAFLTIPLAVTIARGDEPQIQQFDDPKHPGMLAWKVDYVLPEDAGKPEIDLDYDYWDPKVEGDAFSKRRLNSAKVDSTPGTLSFVILLSPKESLITLNGKEFRGKGSSLITQYLDTIQGVELRLSRSSGMQRPDPGNAFHLSLFTSHFSPLPFVSGPALV